MLVAALVVTLVGFALLVVALITSSVAFAWACIVICLVGFGLLIVDVLGVRKSGKSEATAVGPTAASAAAGATAVHAVSAEPDEAETSDTAVTSALAFDAPVLDDVVDEAAPVDEPAGSASSGAGVREAQTGAEVDAAAADETVDLTKQDKP